MLLEPNAKTAVLRDKEKEVEKLIMNILSYYFVVMGNSGRTLRRNDMVKFGKKCEFEQDKTRKSKTK